MARSEHVSKRLDQLASARAIMFFKALEDSAFHEVEAKLRPFQKREESATQKT
jgi:hypothetical protein